MRDAARPGASAARALVLACAPVLRALARAPRSPQGPAPVLVVVAPGRPPPREDLAPAPGGARVGAADLGELARWGLGPDALRALGAPTGGHGWRWVLVLAPTGALVVPVTWPSARGGSA